MYRQLCLFTQNRVIIHDKQVYPLVSSLLPNEQCPHSGIKDQTSDTREFWQVNEAEIQHTCDQAAQIIFVHLDFKKVRLPFKRKKIIICAVGELSI